MVPMVAVVVVMVVMVVVVVVKAVFLLLLLTSEGRSRQLAGRSRHRSWRTLPVLLCMCVCVDVESGWVPHTFFFFLRFY